MATHFKWPRDDVNHNHGIWDVHFHFGFPDEVRDWPMRCFMDSIFGCGTPVIEMGLVCARPIRGDAEPHLDWRDFHTSMRRMVTVPRIPYGWEQRYLYF